MPVTSSLGISEALSLYFHYEVFPLTFLPSRLCQMQVIDGVNSLYLFSSEWSLFISTQGRHSLKDTKGACMSTVTEGKCWKLLPVLALGIKIIKT